MMGFGVVGILRKNSCILFHFLSCFTSLLFYYFFVWFIFFFFLTFEIYSRTGLPLPIPPQFGKLMCPIFLDAELWYNLFLAFFGPGRIPVIREKLKKRKIFLVKKKISNSIQVLLINGPLRR